MNLDKLLEARATEDYMTLFVMGLGALLAIVALVGLVLGVLRRQSKAGNVVGLLVVAILGSGMGGFAAYFRMNRPREPQQVIALSEPVSSAVDESNTVELTALKSANLAGSTQPVSGWNQWRGSGR